MPALHTSFGTTLAERLRRSSIRQAELARAVNCTPQYISQLISGDRPASAEVVEKIARVLNVSPSELDASWKDSKRHIHHFEMMQGIETGYLGAAMRALKAARMSLLAQTPPASLLPGAGKADAMLFDAVTEQAIAAQLRAFNSRCAIITEEVGAIGERRHAASISYVVDPFDRSRPFFRAVSELLRTEKCRTLGDVITDSRFQMRSLLAPFGSITCIREGEIVFNAMLDYASGTVYVASKGFIGYGDIDACPDPHSLAEKGTEVTFSPKPGPQYLCFTGDPDKDRDQTVNEQSSKYEQILKALGFEPSLHLGLTNPGGPARILYLSDVHEDTDNPTFILSNGEKIFEFLGWLAFAVHSQELAVYELYSSGFEARGLILQAPPPNYSAFLPTPTGFRLNLEKIIDLDPPGHYRGAIVVTHARSTVACALMRAKPNSRELYHPMQAPRSPKNTSS
jgi:transcriptional regulator with XRE-family HTH domain